MYALYNVSKKMCTDHLFQRGIEELNSIPASQIVYFYYLRCIHLIVYRCLQHRPKNRSRPLLLKDLVKIPNS